MRSSRFSIIYFHGAALFIAVCLIAARGWAATDGGLPGSFTRFGSGARALGMGGAFGGISDDATAIYWNPAGLSQLLKPELSATHVTLFEDTTDEFFSFAAPFRNYGTFAGSYQLESSGGFERRTSPFDTPTTFSVDNSMLQGGWGWALPAIRRVPGQIRVGASVKQVQEEIDSSRTSGAGADVGFLYQPIEKISFGLLYQNIWAPTINFSRPVTFLRSINITPTYHHIFSKDYSAYLAVNASVYAGDIHPAAGLEFWYAGLLALRMGVQSEGISTGLGIQLGNYQINYATLLHQIGPSQIVTLGIKFGRTQAEIEEEIKKGLQTYSRAEARKLGASYYRQALNYIDQNDYVKAVSYLEIASLWDPENKDIPAKLDEIKQKTEQAVNRQLAERSSMIALRTYQQGDYLLSQANWKNVLDIDPNNDQAKKYLKLIEEKLGHRERENIRLAEEKQTRQHAQDVAAQALALFKEGRYKEAKQQAQRALALYPDEPAAKNIMSGIDAVIKRQIAERYQNGLQMYAKKDYKQALKMFSEILMLDPNDAEAKQQLALCRNALQAAVQANPKAHLDAEKLYYQAVDLYLKGNFKEAQATLNTIFELDPLNEGAKKLQAKLEAASAPEAGR